MPESFGPADLGVVGGLLTQQPKKANAGEGCVAKAIAAAYDSYAPYTHSISGVAILTKNGRIYSGPYLENAAFNPGLSPLHTALVALKIDKQEYTDIVEVRLVEKSAPKISQVAITQLLLNKIAPEVKFEVDFLQNVEL